MKTALALTDLLDKSETWSFLIPLDRIADALSLLTRVAEQPFTRWLWPSGKPLTEQEEARMKRCMADPEDHWLRVRLIVAKPIPHLLIIFDNADDAMMFKLAYA